MNVIIIAASGAVLVGLYKAVMKPNPPQSPAACGAGFFVSTAGVASVLYLLSPHSIILGLSIRECIRVAPSGAYCWIHCGENYRRYFVN